MQFVFIYMIATVAIVVAFFVGLAFRCSVLQSQARDIDQMRLRGGSAV